MSDNIYTIGLNKGGTGVDNTKVLEGTVFAGPASSPVFGAAGFRALQLSDLPAGIAPTGTGFVTVTDGVYNSSRLLAPDDAPQLELGPQYLFWGAGAGAGWTNTTSYATGIGYNAFGTNSNCPYGVAVGSEAGDASAGEFGVYVGHYAGNSTTANNAVFIGCNAGRGITADDVTAVGFGATASGSQATSVGSGATAAANGSAIGYNVTAAADQVVLGNASVTSIVCGGGALTGINNSGLSAPSTTLAVSTVYTLITAVANGYYLLTDNTGTGARFQIINGAIQTPEVTVSAAAYVLSGSPTTGQIGLTIAGGNLQATTGVALPSGVTSLEVHRL